MSTNLPPAVQRQLDQADAIQAQMQAALTEQVAEQAPAESTEPAVVETPEQPSVEQTSSKSSDDAAYWKQRFSTLQGMMNQEVSKLSTQLRERDDKLQDILQKVDTLSQQSAKKEDTKLVTDADVESFGEDMVDMVRRAAREEFDALAKKFAGELDKRFGAVAAKVEQTEQVVVKSAKDKFWDAVDTKHADFEAVNSDPRWFAFLDTRIPGSRLTRRTLAEKAIAELDAEALIEQVGLFKDSLPKAEPQQPTKPKPTLNSQVAPNTSGASNHSPDPVGKIWTGAEYAAALDHRNMQRMSRADYDALVAEAETAFAEGRVRF